MDPSAVLLGLLAQVFETHPRACVLAIFVLGCLLAAASTLFEGDHPAKPILALAGSIALTAVIVFCVAFPSLFFNVRAEASLGTLPLALLASPFILFGCKRFIDRLG